MVLLMVITVGYLPLVLPILLPGVSVNPARIAGSLVVLMLLPLAVALAVNAKLPGAAARAKPLFDRLSSLGLILVVVLLVVVNFNKVLSVFGTRAILAGLLFIALGYAVGWALGGPATDTRPRLGLGDGAAQHCRGARGGRPKLQRPQCRRHGGRRRDRQSPDTPADVTAARQERLVTAQAARGARLPAGLLRQGRRELSVPLRAIGLVLHDDSVGWEPKEHQHISRLSGFRVAVLRVAFGHDDRRLREELCDDQTRQPGRRRVARIVPSGCARTPGDG